MAKKWFVKFTRAQLRERSPEFVAGENATLRLVVAEQRQQITDLKKLVRYQNNRRCENCANLRPFELTDELFTCPALNIRLHRESVLGFWCSLFEPKASDAS